MSPWKEDKPYWFQGQRSPVKVMLGSYEVVWEYDLEFHLLLSMVIFYSLFVTLILSLFPETALFHTHLFQISHNWWHIDVQLWFWICDQPSGTCVMYCKTTKILSSNFHRLLGNSLCLWSSVKVINLQVCLIVQVPLLLKTFAVFSVIAFMWLLQVHLCVCNVILRALFQPRSLSIKYNFVSFYKIECGCVICKCLCVCLIHVIYLSRTLYMYVHLCMPVRLSQYITDLHLWSLLLYVLLVSVWNDLKC